MEEGDDIIDHLNVFNWCINDLLWLEVKYDRRVKPWFYLDCCYSPSSIFGPCSCSVRRHFGLRRSCKTSLPMWRWTKDLVLTQRMKDFSQKGQMIIGDNSKKGGPMENHRRSRSKSCKNVECYYCHKNGHIKRQCKKFKDDLKEGNKPESMFTMGVTIEHATKFLSLSSAKLILDFPILDYGCSFHVCT